jgi:signal transduction histidine kinase
MDDAAFPSPEWPAKTHEAEQPGLRAAMRATSRSILAAQQRAELELLEAHDALRRQNEALAVANSILEATLEATPVGVMVADRQGCIGMRNRRFDEMWSFEPPPRAAGLLQDLVALIATRLARPDLFQTWSTQVMKRPEGEYGLQCETLDGRHLHCQALPQRQGDRVVGVVYNWLDVTESVDGETLRSQVRAADLVARERAAFIARASHELRTPLNAVLGFSQLMQANDTVSSNASLALQVGHIRSAGEHLRALMDDLMQVSRLDTGAFPLDIEALDFVAVLGEAVALLQPQATVCDVRIEAVPTLGAWVRGDRTRVLQVLLNLLSNAVKYNRRGGRVGLALRADGGNWHLEISDEGPGLSAQQVDHLFEPFNRLGAERSTTQGTGLGLVITRQLLLAMQGGIKARSLPGRGAAFAFWLPRVEAAGA